MASKYWIKLYHEILYDRKMASMDDHLWRRVIECFLAAGEVNKKGFLPSLADMAWTLRTDEEVLETDLNELVRIGILEHREGRYFVTKFAKRQRAMSKAEYMRRLRDERQKDEYYQPSYGDSYQPVTNSNAEVEVDKEVEVDGQPSLSEYSAAFVNASHIPEKTTEKWIEALKTIRNEQQATPEHVTEAVKQLHEKKFNISGPWSIINAVAIVLANEDGNHKIEAFFEEHQ